MGFSDGWVRPGGRTTSYVKDSPPTLPMIHIFTPSFADDADSNAQNLSVKEIVCRLPPEQFRVTMFSDAAPDPRIAARPNTRLLPWHRRGNTVRALAALLRDVPDVYFFPREGPLDSAFLSLKNSLFRRTALVTYIVSGGLYNPGPVRPGLARNVRRADVVVGNCKFLSSLIAEKLHVAASTIYDGIDRRYFFAPELPPPTEPVVLFAGSFRPYKRALLTVRLAASRANVRFRLAGTGEEESACRRFVADHACANVEFLGHLTSAQLGDEMRRASVFFHPSLLEGHPQVLGQAAACGLPAIALNLYRPEFIVHDETGFLAANDAELEQRLDQLLASPDLRLSMSHKAVELARNFDWDEVTACWAQTFLNAASTKIGGKVQPA